MSDVYICKPLRVGFRGQQACLKIKSKFGEELSISFDDSCGAFDELSRSNAVLFDAHGKQLENVDWITPERLYEMLGKLLKMGA